MKYNTLKYISEPTATDLSRGYVYTSADLTDLASASINSFPFGTSENDAVNVSIMSVDGAELYKYTISSSLKYIPHTKSFIDVNNIGTTYNYSNFESEFVIVGAETRSLFLDVAGVFAAADMNQGTYLLGINPVRYMVGTPTDTIRSLVVREISSTGTEVSVSPTTLPTDLDADSVAFNENFLSFTQNKFPVNQLINPLLFGIETPSIYNAYYNAYAVDSGSAELIKSRYAFFGDINWSGNNIEYQDKNKSDATIIQFITDIYYGVKRGSLRSNGQISTQDIRGIYDQFKNTLFSNYKSATTFKELRDIYYSLAVHILTRELNQISNIKLDESERIIGFFTSILYDIIFLPIINRLENEFTILFSGYLKNSACFADGTELSILNYAASARTDASGNGLLLLKFAATIPTTIKIGSRLWIANQMVTDAIVQSVYLYSDNTIYTTQLRGPNFSVSTELIGNGTATTSMEDIVGVTGSLYDEVISKLNSKQSTEIKLDVDYRYFENFIKFSSASERLRIFTTKSSQIRNYTDQLAIIDAKLLINPTDDQYIKDRTSIDAEINATEASMDGYELFLYNNPSWYSEHSAVYNGETSASLYDRDNRASLQSSIPSYVVENSDNLDYVTFVNMVGHYFDNLSTHITQFTRKNNPTNSNIGGISSDVVYSMLTSLGWEPESGKENLPLLLSAFSKSDFDVSSSLWNMVGSMSETERNQTIWRRILTNLPYILKSKGTATAIQTLANCYGIPQNLLSIKEYGGIENNYTADQNSVYSFGETKYAMAFAGSGEYLSLPWTGSLQSVEFSISFDPNKTSSEGQVFRLANCSDSWLVGFVRERGLDWGRAFFTIRDASGSLLTTMTPRVPIFSGETFTVLIRKNDLQSDFLRSPYYDPVLSDSYPRVYDLNIIRSDMARETFAASASIILSGSYNSQWNIGSNIYLGNYQQNTSSLNVNDPEAFFGTLDEIKLSETVVDLVRLKNHASYLGAYDSGNPVDTIDKSLVRISIGNPIDLHSDSGIVEINNSAFRSDYPTIQAIAFPVATSSIIFDEECNTTEYISGYPYQFKPTNLQQFINLPNFGSTKFRSNKVNYTTSTLVSNLSSDTRSTLQSSVTNTTDSNKLGIFFSPTDAINSEILKFFGRFEFGDLIGSPSDVYKKTYPNFEIFRKLYFDQGGGQLDYQLFINMVRSYFDKSMFKYAQSLVPARTKTVSGILIEPSILERSKIQQKKPQNEIHRNISTNISVDNAMSGIVVGQLTQSLDVTVRGKSLYDDYNRVFYNTQLDPHGFGIYADHGISYYNDDYWRVDIVPNKRTITVESKFRMPLAQTNEFDVVNTERGRYQIISQSYDSINISRFPVLSEYPIEKTMILNTINVGNQSQRTEFSNFRGTISRATFNFTIQAGTHPFNNAVASSSFAHMLITGTTTSPNILSSSLYGTINAPVGVSGYIGIDQPIILSGSYTATGSTISFSGSIILDTGTEMSMSFYSPTPTVSVFDVLKLNARGPLFNYIDTITYEYRRDLSFQNIPIGSRSLHGYYFTHYKYKKQNFSRKPMALRNIDGNVEGIFSRGVQTQKTTVQDTGLLDNSLPIVITNIG